MKKVSRAVFARVVLVTTSAVLLAGAACSGGTETSGNATPPNAPPAPQASRTLPRGTDDPAAVRTRLAELFGLCKTNGINSAASYFVYRGPDKAREWKDTYRAADPAERAAVQDGCARIKGYLDKSEGYTFGPVKVEKESEGDWHVIEVSFKQGAETRRVAFAFLPVKGQFSVGDIDQ
ncbi:MAG TPA: hypothetical protein VD861_20835 [Pyrinomonadaceae bacterium]|jgi:hypothetical protein|nr:hypothetical protein [Pyrinomonadaceae bacterium]